LGGDHGFEVSADHQGKLLDIGERRKAVRAVNEAMDELNATMRQNGMTEDDGVLIMMKLFDLTEEEAREALR